MYCHITRLFSDDYILFQSTLKQHVFLAKSPFNDYFGERYSGKCGRPIAHRYVPPTTYLNLKTTHLFDEDSILFECRYRQYVSLAKSPLITVLFFELHFQENGVSDVIKICITDKSTNPL